MPPIYRKFLHLSTHIPSNITFHYFFVFSVQFAKMKALTQDEALLRKALERSTINIIDDRIKPNIKAAGRSTIILREIPSDTAESEVREIFEFEGCKLISSMRSDIGDTWYVTPFTDICYALHRYLSSPSLILVFSQVT